jgi:hypothetical protein
MDVLDGIGDGWTTAMAVMVALALATAVSMIAVEFGVGSVPPSPDEPHATSTSSVRLVRMVCNFFCMFLSFCGNHNAEGILRQPPGNRKSSHIHAIWELIS